MIDNFKFKIIKNVLAEEEIKLLKIWFSIKQRINFNSFDCVQNDNADSMFYGNPITDALLLKTTPLIEKNIEEELLPTYSYSRIYTKFADLKKHKDRPSCEISVTVQIGSCGTPWSIFMDGNEVKLNNGDAVVYLGCELDHWREEFTGDWHAQTFLHYVDQDGPFADYKNDKNPLIGCEYENNK